MKWILLLAVMVSAVAANAQQNVQWRKDKVTQIIFPSDIVKFRAGYTSNDALTQSDGRVLYVQPIGSLPETNLNVITADGNYYAFNLVYSDTIHVVNYIIRPSMAFYQETEVSEVISGPSEEAVRTTTAQSTRSSAGAVPGREETSIQRKFSLVKEQGSYIVANNVVRLQKLIFLLEGVYVDQQQVFFKFRIENVSNVPFDIDYIAFSVTAKKTKKASTQERLQIQPLAVDVDLHRVDARASCEVIYCFEKFTIGKDKILLAGVLEKGGDRNIGLRMPENFIIEARKL